MFILSRKSILAVPDRCMCGKVIGPWLSIQQYKSEMSEKGFDSQAQTVVRSSMCLHSVLCAVLIKEDGSHFLAKNVCCRAPLC
jgi:hypothetical protein